MGSSHFEKLDFYSDLTKIEQVLEDLMAMSEGRSKIELEQRFDFVDNLESEDSWEQIELDTNLGFLGYFE